jgi:hypothetical protein
MTSPASAPIIAQPFDEPLRHLLGLEAGGGDNKPSLAAAASMLGACDHMLRDGVPYRDLSSEHFAPRDRVKTVRHLARGLRDLGCEVDAIMRRAVSPTQSVAVGTEHAIPILRANVVGPAPIPPGASRRLTACEVPLARRAVV